MIASRLAPASILLLTFWQSLGAQSRIPANNSPQPNGTVTVPADTTIPLALRSAISSKTAYPGEAIYCRTVFPIAVNNRIVIPDGSYVKGEITQVVKPGRIKGKAKLGIRFDTLTLPNGVTEQLRAVLSSFAGNGTQGFDRKEGKVEGQSTRSRDVGQIARATIVGAELGSIAGISGGHTLRGLGIGSAAGGAAGAVWVMATRGKNIYLPPGTNLELQLTAPLQFDESQLVAR